MNNYNNLKLNRFFSKQIIQDLIKSSDNEIYSYVIDNYIKVLPKDKNKDIVSKIYKYMSNHYRNEYFYQNTLLNKLLLGKYSINTTMALSQLPIANSIADFILIHKKQNKAMIYEIKTELDTFDRLKTQLDDYYKAFNYVSVVTCEENYLKLYNQLKNTSVGIYVLSKKNTIKVKKNAEEYNENLNHEILFKILRKKEYENILKIKFGSLPKSTQVFHYNECLKLFKTIPILEAYIFFLSELKNRNITSKNEAFKSIPYELKSLIYFSNFKDLDFKDLEVFLNNIYMEATKCIIHTLEENNMNC